MGGRSRNQGKLKGGSCGPPGRMQPAGPPKGLASGNERSSASCLFARSLSHLLSVHAFLLSPQQDMVASQLLPLAASVPAPHRDPHAVSLGLNSRDAGERI